MKHEPLQGKVHKATEFVSGKNRCWKPHDIIIKKDVQSAVAGLKADIRKKTRTGHPLKEIARNMKNQGLKVAMPDGGWINQFELEKLINK